MTMSFASRVSSSPYPVHLDDIIHTTVVADEHIVNYVSKPQKPVSFFVGIIKRLCPRRRGLLPTFRHEKLDGDKE